MEIHDPALTVALALAAGIVAQSLAQHLRIPGIVLLLATGVLLGPDGAGLIFPEDLGEGLHMLVGLAVAVILFEGGLSLDIGRLRQEGRTIRRLITAGALVTATGGTLAARLFMGWEWRLCILFGTLVIVTGPTVIQPLLRRIRVGRHLRTILEGEGVLIDPIGAIVAVVVLEVVVTAGHEAAEGLVDVASRLGFGLAIGLAGGLAIAALLHLEKPIPAGLENVVTLALVLALFELSDALLLESGIMAVAIAGITVGNIESHVRRELREFKEQLTILLVGLLFVLLAAHVRIADVVALGWPAVATVLALMFVVRPLNVLVSTAGSELGRNDRLFMAWLAPRGIVAAAVASLFAQRLEVHEMPGGGELMALVFLVIAITVLVEGGAGGLVASALGVRRPKNQGLVLVGANAVGRALARALRAEGEEVVLVDTNAIEAQAAEEEGHRVVYGNANEERTLLQADVEARRGFVAVTPNEGVNVLLARRAREVYRVPSAWAALHHRRLGVQTQQVHEAGAGLLFGRAVDMGEWTHELVHENAVLERWRYEPASPPAGETESWAPPEALPVLPLAVVRGRRISPVDDALVPRRDDRVWFVWFREADDDVRAWLRGRSWVPDPAQSTPAAEVPVAPGARSSFSGA